MPPHPPSPGPSRTARGVAAVARFAAARPVGVVAGCVLLAAAGLALSAARLAYKTDRNDLLSADRDVQKRWQKYLAAFGDDDDMVFVVKGTDPARMAAAADFLADKLAARPDRFDRVFHRCDLRGLAARGLYYLPEAELAAIDARLAASAPLLGSFAGVSWRAFSVQSLLAQAAAAKDARAAGKPLSAADETLLAGLPNLLAAAAETIADPAAYRNPWAAAKPAPDPRLIDPQYLFTPDRTLALVLARPVKADASFTPADAAAAAGKEILAAARPAFPDLEFGLTGIPVLEGDEMRASEADSDRASIFALVGVALLYFVVYRGVRYPLLTVGTLAAGTVWAVGWATLTVGHLNILSAAFAVMIIGMGDYGVLWVARYDEERRRGRGHAAALHETALHAGPGIATAAVTTALAFFAVMFADFRAVAELGWIAGCGVLFCAAACFTLLPALLTLSEKYSFRATPVPAPETLPFPGPAGTFFPGLAARPRRVLAVAAGVLVVASGLAARVSYDPNLLNMQADGLDSVAWEQELVRHAAGATWDAITIAPTREAALAAKAKYEQTPGVGRVVEAASLIPANQEAKRAVVAGIHAKLAGLPAAPPEPMEPDAAAVRRLATRAAPIFALAINRQPDAVVAGRLHAFDTRMAADLAADLAALKAVSAPDPVTPDTLPPAFRERYIGANGEFLVRAFAAENLWEYAKLREFTAAARTADPEATGKSFRTLEGLDQMKRGFGRAGLLALTVIVAVLLLDFRSLRMLFLGLLPLAAGAALTLGVMGLCGVPLNPANLIALPLIVGVGVENGVHVLHDYADRRRGVPYRLGASTGRGILVAALTTILGFGTLMLARHRGMAGLGFVLALGVTACLAAAVVVLPAVLRLMGEEEDAAAVNPAPAATEPAEMTTSSAA